MRSRFAAKILPQSFHNLIKPDPAITQENPEPIVYRCRKCRRVLVSKSHLMQHQSKQHQQQKYDQAIAAENCAETVAPLRATAPRLLEQIAAQIRKVSLVSGSAPAAVTMTATNTVSSKATNADDAEDTNAATGSVICQSILFVEPIAWMKNISHNTQGRLNCPKCEQKLGNFSWINGELKIKKSEIIFFFKVYFILFS